VSREWQHLLMIAPLVTLAIGYALGRRIRRAPRSGS